MDLETVKTISTIGTPILAVTAFILSVYQEVRRWSLSRPSVTATLGWGFAIGDGASFLPVTKNRRPNLTVARQATGSPSSTTLVVSVHNDGGVAIDVSGVDLLFANGAVMTHGLLVGQPKFPFRLEPHGEMTWAFNEKIIRSTVKGFGADQDVRLSVRLPGGKHAKTKEYLTYPADGGEPR